MLGAGLLGAGVLGAVSLGAAAPGAQAADLAAAPQVRCTPEDPRLTELSGLVVADDGSLLAVGDGGAAPQVLHLDAACAVTAVTTADVDPYDVEDLARGPGGTLWLADTGDNDRARDTVAVLVLSSADPGRVDAELHRLTYPDGPHDAEALLVDATGRPFVVTKEIGGSAGVYAPTEALASPGPVPLRRVATVTVAGTGTPGGPVGPLGSVVVTGAAASPDGSVVALRTYTDAYLYDAPGGDVVAALAGEPLRVPLPDEPQGEALALSADGTLLSAGEQRGGTGLPPVVAVPGAVAALRDPARAPSPAAPTAVVAPPAADAAPAPAEPAGTSSRTVGLAALALLVLGGAGVLVARRRGPHR